MRGEKGGDQYKYSGLENEYEAIIKAPEAGIPSAAHGSDSSGADIHGAAHGELSVGADGYLLKEFDLMGNPHWSRVFPEGRWREPTQEQGENVRRNKKQRGIATYKPQPASPRALCTAQRLLSRRIGNEGLKWRLAKKEMVRVEVPL